MCRRNVYMAAQTDLFSDRRLRESNERFRKITWNESNKFIRFVFQQEKLIKRTIPTWKKFALQLKLEESQQCFKKIILKASFIPTKVFKELGHQYLNIKEARNISVSADFSLRRDHYDWKWAAILERHNFASKCRLFEKLDMFRSFRRILEK
ncbi:hypothetical protein TcasGA2_TC010263 [Tribolium castaneum]|uniref:Uncharacterized protein n=1 Tax=Tribolium castaneum TaxID=7070 RepID=D7EJR9_TRICA|nr:hypothetical protein TcasGA2_TC010263 [Tribolium castaneum]